MATYTPNIGLHQWAPEDDFLRTDFNTDLSKIDAVLGSTGQSTRSNGYNVCNLMLQNYYDGKPVHYADGVLLDGFLDGGRVSQLSQGFALDTANRRLYLDATGQSDVDHNYGATVGAYIGPRKALTASWTAEGYGTLTGAWVYLDGTATFSISNAAGEVLTSQQQSSSGGSVLFTLSADIEMGQVYQIKLQNDNSSGNMMVQRKVENDDTFGFKLVITPVTVTSGVMTGTAQAVGAWHKAVAWVRHDQGSVTMAQGGQAMTLESVRTTKNLDNQVCLESCFELASSGTSFQPVLGVTTQTGQSVSVYDYCIALM